MKSRGNMVDYQALSFRDVHLFGFFYVGDINSSKLVLGSKIKHQKCTETHSAGSIHLYDPDLGSALNHTRSSFTSTSWAMISQQLLSAPFPSV